MEIEWRRQLLTNISPEKAQEILLDFCNLTETVEIPLEASLGSVLAENICADIDIPPFDKSPLDGYAVRAEDIKTATDDTPVTLDVIDFIPAGYVSKKRVGEKQAARIMTGAKIPEGADVVIRFEETEFTDTDVKIFNSYPKGTNIIKKAEDIKKGSILLEKGTVIDAAQVGILATLGKKFVKTYRKPKVAILSTGDELVPVGALLTDGKIRDSNSYFIGALVKNLGAEPTLLGSVKDKIEDIQNALKPALDWADIIITTGGVSVGDRDVVKDAFEALGAKPIFWRIKMKPGGPIATARYGRKLLIGLSGNPAAAYITFELFVRPLILKTLGKNYKPLVVKSTLQSNFTKVRKQDRYIRAKTLYEDGRFYTYLPQQHSSGIVSSLAGMNSLLKIPAEKGPFNIGDEVYVKLLDFSVYQEE